MSASATAAPASDVGVNIGIPWACPAGGRKIELGPHGGDTIMQLYPDKALNMGVSGAATIDCDVSGAGEVGSCTLVSEQPQGFGFGKAALRFGCMLEFGPGSEGYLSGGHFVRAIKFQMPN
jgi:hypothetical protein